MIWKKYRRQWTQIFRYKTKYLFLPVFCCKLVVRSLVRSFKHSFSVWLIESVRPSVRQIDRQTDSKSASQPANQSVRPSFCQSVLSSVSQSVSHCHLCVHNRSFVCFYWFWIVTFYLLVARFWRKEIPYRSFTTETTWFKRWIFSCQKPTAWWQSKMELRT